MSEINEIAIAIAAGGLVSGALLIAEHVGLWEQRAELTNVQRYAVGVATLNVGTTITALMLTQPLIAIVAWAISIWGGALISFAYWLRATLDARDAAQQRATQAARAALRMSTQAAQNDDAERTDGKPDYRRN